MSNNQQARQAASSSRFTDKEIEDAFEEANRDFEFEARRKELSDGYLRKLHVIRTALKRWIDERKRKADHINHFMRKKQARAARERKEGGKS